MRHRRSKGTKRKRKQVVATTEAVHSTKTSDRLTSSKAVVSEEKSSSKNENTMRIMTRNRKKKHKQEEMDDDASIHESHGVWRDNDTHTEEVEKEEAEDCPWKGCICGKIHPRPIPVFWIQCDGPCNAWYNVSPTCVGFDEMDASKQCWYCIDCCSSCRKCPQLDLLLTFPADVWYTILTFVAGEVGDEQRNNTMIIGGGGGPRHNIIRKTKFLVLRLAPLCKAMYHAIYKEPWLDIWSLLLHRDYQHLIAQQQPQQEQHSWSTIIGNSPITNYFPENATSFPGFINKRSTNNNHILPVSSSPGEITMVSTNSTTAAAAAATTTTTPGIRSSGRSRKRPRRLQLYEHYQSAAPKQQQHRSSPRERVRAEYQQICSRTEDAATALMAFSDVHHPMHEPRKGTLTLKNLRDTITRYSPIDIDRRCNTSEGRTLLHICCAADAHEGVVLRCVKELIEVYGANPYVYTNGEAPYADCPVLYFAISRVMPSVVQYLIDVASVRHSNNSTATSFGSCHTSFVNNGASINNSNRSNNNEFDVDDHMTLSSLMQLKATGYFSYVSSNNFYGSFTPYEYACKLKQVESSIIASSSSLAVLGSAEHYDSGPMVYNNNTDETKLKNQDHCDTTTVSTLGSSLSSTMLSKIDNNKTQHETLSLRSNNNKFKKALPPYWANKLNACIKILSRANNHVHVSGKQKHNHNNNKNKHHHHHTRHSRYE